MKMKCLPLYVALVFGGLMLISCSSTLKPEPPKTVTDPTVVATYKKAVAGDVKSLRFISAQYKAGAAGFPKSPRQAANALYMAANAGDTQSQLELAKCYEEGYGRMQDISKAAGWYHKAGEQGSKIGKSKAKELSQRIAEARAERENAVQSPNSEQQRTLSNRELFEFARQHANTSTQKGLKCLGATGMFLYEGIGCQQNLTLGLQYVRRAAQLGDADSQQYLRLRGLGY